ncbi:MAG: amidohydrolase [Haloarculaceae archaeon]
MTEAADRVFVNAAVHPLVDPARAHEPAASAVAVRDGRVVRVTDDDEAGFLVGVETDVVDLDGLPLLPGFVDAHTHLTAVGRRLVRADLSGASDRDDCRERLRAEGEGGDDWLVGFGYDESGWPDARPLDRADLDAVSESGPVAAVREDMHLVSLNGAALERLGDALPASGVRTAGGEPTGVVVEAAAGAVLEAVEPGGSGLRDRLLAAQKRAHAVGITGVHEMVDRPALARAYRELDRVGDLSLRVRLYYYADLLDAVRDAGLVRDHGSEFVRTGGVKAFADGSLGAHTARLGEPYADAPDERGEWATDPDELADVAAAADAADLQVAVHAIGDEAIAAVVDAVEGADPAARHRIEHAEVLPDDLLDRLVDAGLVVSVQPNFLKWARPGGLYERRLGPERTRATDRFGDLREADAALAFGSDCMPLDPLFGIQQAVTAPAAGQRLSVTQALAAYTRGAAHAAGNEVQAGTIEPGKRADFTVLAASPWSVPEESIADVGVAMTVVDGAIVHDAR